MVLVQCGTAKRVFHNDIRRGFDWILRTGASTTSGSSMSVGGDYEANIWMIRCAREWRRPRTRESSSARRSETQAIPRATW